MSLFLFFFLFMPHLPISFFFFFNDTATTEIYTLSLHDALPIFRNSVRGGGVGTACDIFHNLLTRSEEHTSELQSPCNLVCRLLLEKKKKNSSNHFHSEYCRLVDRVTDQRSHL